MTYEYGRYHENALGEYNYNFMQPENGKTQLIPSLPTLTGANQKLIIPSAQLNGFIGILMMF